MLAASGLQAFHRSGQTFLTWTEDASVAGEKYHVYRSTLPITTASLSQAQLLTGKWGALDDNTSVHRHAAPDSGVPATFVIQDLGTPLSAEQGLFVFTTPQAQSGTFYYAVTQVTGGTESTSLDPGSNSLLNGIVESTATPQPVLTVSTNAGKGRIYTQYMDYAAWNPTFQGYAYNYSVALPDNYDPSVLWPVKLMPHAYIERFRMESKAEYGWQSIEVFVDDSGGTAENIQTWWYGFAADHNYQTGGSVPTQGVIENFTEQRVLKTLDEVVANFSADPLRIHSQGHSMGASGSVSLGMRYPDVLAGIYASEPMTDYRSSPLFQSDFTALWGSRESNLPIVNRGTHASHLQKYDGTGVYDWMDHQQQLIARRGEDMAFLMIGHGKADRVIDWATQGQPIIASLNTARVGFTSEQRGGWDHTWMGYGQSLDNMFSPAAEGLSQWVYPRNRSFLSFTNGTGSGPNVPGSTGTNFYNMQFEWSVPWNSFHTDMVDTRDRYEVSVRSTTVEQTADITPRKLQVFDVTPGQQVSWQNVNNATGQLLQSGTVTVDADGLVTIPQVRILKDAGNRLTLNAINPLVPPTMTSPQASTSLQTPAFSWSEVRAAASYELWVSNITTNVNPVISISTAGTSWTPAESLGIGRYRIWVRSVSASGQKSAWSAPRDLQIDTPVTLNAPSGLVPTDRPVFAWSALKGAVKYDLWVNNNTTGESQVIRDGHITGTSFESPKSLPLGKYSVWVRGIDARGGAAKWSLVGAFTVATRTPRIGPVSPTFDTTPEFRWQAVNGATEYEISVMDRRNNATVISQTGITSTSWTPTTPMGDSNYRWWVRASRGTGLRGVWGEGVDFNVIGKPVVTTTPGTATSRTPVFSWTPVEGAVRYELWVSRMDTSTRVIHDTQLTATSFTPSDPLSPASYRIWVRAVTAENTFSVWSDAVTITVVDTDPGSPGLGSDASVLLVAVFEDFSRWDQRPGPNVDSKARGRETEGSPSESLTGTRENSFEPRVDRVEGPNGTKVPDTLAIQPDFGNPGIPPETRITIRNPNSEI